MKKIISLIFCIALLALVLVSCGEEEHVHQYNRGEWKTDGTNHWYAATCSCSDAGVKNSAAHVDTMNNGYCDVCGYLMCDKVAYEIKTDESIDSHWYGPADCDHVGEGSHLPIKDIAPHEYDENGTCTVCSSVCKNTSYSTAWESDETNHWHEPACGHTAHLPISGVETHVDVALDENGLTDGKCDTCGYVICAIPTKAEGESDDDFAARLAAFYETTYSYSETEHWLAPVCGHNHEVIGLEKHVDSGETPDGLCDVCNQPMSVSEEIEE